MPVSGGYLDATVAEARTRGFVTPSLGGAATCPSWARAIRVRPVRERAATNTPSKARRRT